MRVRTGDQRPYGRDVLTAGTGLSMRSKTNTPRTALIKAKRTNRWKRRASSEGLVAKSLISAKPLKIKPASVQALDMFRIFHAIRANTSPVTRKTALERT